MELAAPRRITTLKGGAIATGVCLLGLALSARLQALTGNSGMLLILLLSAAVASWFAGHWAGLLTTGVAASVVAFFLMPPDYSFRISDPHDTAALGSFAIGGVIISLLCGAAWQLRSEAASLRQVEGEMVMLRSRNSKLSLQAKHAATALHASGNLLQEFARATRSAIATGRGMEQIARVAEHLEQECAEPAPCAVDCSALYRGSAGALPEVWADETDLRRLFAVLSAGAHRKEPLRISASQLPEWWLFVAGFPAGPLTPLEFSLCEHLVIRQGGRCWASATIHGDWEMRFLLRRTEGVEAQS